MPHLDERTSHRPVEPTQCSTIGAQGESPWNARHPSDCADMLRAGSRDTTAALRAFSKSIAIAPTSANSTARRVLEHSNRDQSATYTCRLQPGEGNPISDFADSLG